MKIPVAVCEVTYAKMRLADSPGIGVIGPPREECLHRAKMLIAGIFKHALSRRQLGRRICACKGAHITVRAEELTLLRQIPRH